MRNNVLDDMRRLIKLIGTNTFTSELELWEVVKTINAFRYVDLYDISGGTNVYFEDDLETLIDDGVITKNPWELTDRGRRIYEKLHDWEDHNEFLLGSEFEKEMTSDDVRKALDLLINNNN